MNDNESVYKQTPEAQAQKKLDEVRRETLIRALQGKGTYRSGPVERKP